MIPLIINSEQEPQRKECYFYVFLLMPMIGSEYENSDKTIGCGQTLVFQVCSQFSRWQEAGLENDRIVFSTSLFSTEPYLAVGFLLWSYNIMQQNYEMLVTVALSNKCLLQTIWVSCKCTDVSLYTDSLTHRLFVLMVTVKVDFSPFSTVLKNAD